MPFIGRNHWIPARFRRGSRDVIGDKGTGDSMDCWRDDTPISQLRRAIRVGQIEPNRDQIGTGAVFGQIPFGF